MVIGCESQRGVILEGSGNREQSQAAWVKAVFTSSTRLVPEKPDRVRLLQNASAGTLCVWGEHKTH